MSLLSWLQSVPEAVDNSENDDWGPDYSQNSESYPLIPFLASEDEDCSVSDSGEDFNSYMDNGESKEDTSLQNTMAKRVAAIAEYVDKLDYIPKKGVSPASLKARAKAAQVAGERKNSEWALESLILESWLTIETYRVA
jgi:hypothetical protein